MAKCGDILERKAWVPVATRLALAVCMALANWLFRSVRGTELSLREEYVMNFLFGMVWAWLWGAISCWRKSNKAPLWALLLYVPVLAVTGQLITPIPIGGSVFMFYFTMSVLFAVISDRIGYQGLRPGIHRHE